jgi:hypothetical protein
VINIYPPAVDEILNWYVEHIKIEYERSTFVKIKGTCWEVVNNWLLVNLGVTFDEVLRADVVKLQVLKNKFDQNIKPIVIPNFIWDMTETYAKFASTSTGIGRYPRIERITALHLIDKFDSLSCPYCNKTQLENRKDQSIDFEMRNCQFDHFFHESKYPFFALSFYNLVPACQPCNLAKLTKTIEAHPYSSTDISNLTTFKWKGDFKDLASLEISATFEGGMLENNKSLGILGNYKKANLKILQDTLMKMDMNPKESIEDMLVKRPEFYKSFQVALESMFEVALTRETLFTRPNSKFKFDIISDYYKIGINQ